MSQQVLNPTPGVDSQGKRRPSSVSGLAVALLLIANMAPAGTNAVPASHTLTPAASVSSTGPISTGDDIRDIRQPRHLPSTHTGVVALAGVILLGAAVFAARHLLRRRRLGAVPPHERALQELAAARALMDPDRARDYAFAVSEIIRRYLETRFQVHTPRLTTEEFLRDLVEVREAMLASHRERLGNFLWHCDLAKFAGWRYAASDLEAMHDCATGFVRETVAVTTPTPPSSPEAATSPATGPVTSTTATPEPALATAA